MVSGNSNVCGQIKGFRWVFLHLNSSAKLSATITALDQTKWVTSHISWEIKGSKNVNFQTWYTWYLPAIIIDKKRIVERVMTLNLLNIIGMLRNLWKNSNSCPALPRKETQTSTSHGLDRVWNRMWKTTFATVSYPKVWEIKGPYIEAVDFFANGWSNSY